MACIVRIFNLHIGNMSTIFWGTFKPQVLQIEGNTICREVGVGEGVWGVGACVQGFPNLFLSGTGIKCNNKIKCVRVMPFG